MLGSDTSFKKYYYRVLSSYTLLKHVLIRTKLAKNKQNL